MNASGRRLLLQGYHVGNSGTALIHERLAEYLPSVLEDWKVIAPTGRPLAPPSLIRRFAQKIEPHDAVVLTSTPMPLRPPGGRIIALVYDFRWLSTRGPVGALYRGVDFMRTARNADSLLAISSATAAQAEFLSRMKTPLSVLPLGPGQWRGDEIPECPRRDGPILLIGSATHKRNKLTAQLLCASRQISGNHSLVAVNVSPDTAEYLTKHYRGDLMIHGKVSRGSLLDILRSARSYVALGLFEGSGFPYVEAAFAGCDVMCPRTTLTNEVLGDHANWVPWRPSVADLEAALDSWTEDRVASLQRAARQRSWECSARALAGVVDPTR